MSELLDKNGMTEEQFLAVYRPGDYERPSVTVDMVIFSVFDKENENYRKLPEKELKVLLIQRGGHPCLGMWALPGGFVEPDETTEQAAARELKEETGVGGIYLEQLYTFSDPHRDPRTWIMSCSYIALADRSRLDVHASDDARMAKWFSVSLEELSVSENRTDEELVRVSELCLCLKCADITLKARLRHTARRSDKGSMSEYEIIDTGGLAFDHAKIIACAVLRLRGKVEYTDIALNLMPELFTMTELQQVYELILGRELIKAPFRRKYSFLAEPTDNTTEDEGHRPSKLYRKRWSL